MQSLINLTNDLGIPLPPPPNPSNAEIRAAGPPSLAEAALDMERSMRRTLGTVNILITSLRAQLLG